MTSSASELTLESVIVRSDALVSSALGSGEVVMMDVEDGNYYGLEFVAARIWELLAAPMSIAALSEQLIAEYQVPADTCRAEVLAFVGSLLERKVVRVS